MSRTEVYDGLKEILSMVKPKTDLSKITEEDNLITDLAIDSLSMLLMSLAIENKFGIQIDEKQQFLTVKDVVDYVGNACNGKG
ncbi:MAG: hypothetical protein IJS02_03730 [Bacteroidales bacterium]|nr:hypothetical protein [Bacteroidales bacterium]